MAHLDALLALAIEGLIHQSNYLLGVEAVAGSVRGLF
jgi:hypothetical protein